MSNIIGESATYLARYIPVVDFKRRSSYRLVSCLLNSQCFSNGSKKSLTRVIYPFPVSMYIVCIMELVRVLNIGDIQLVGCYVIINKSFPWLLVTGYHWSVLGIITRTKRVLRSKILEANRECAKSGF